MYYISNLIFKKFVYIYNFIKMKSFLIFLLVQLTLVIIKVDIPFNTNDDCTVKIIIVILCINYIAQS